jgi:transposase
VVAKRAAFARRVPRLKARRYVFVDEAGANTGMLRSHAWIKAGQELVEGKPANWGGNMTMAGAVTLEGVLALNTMFKAMNRERFVLWVRDSLAPKLRKGDAVFMDNLKAHHDPLVEALVRARGAKVVYLPPYSPDLNPIESVWALIKKRIRAVAPRSKTALRKAAHAARHQVLPRHTVGFFRHAGYTLGLN